MAQQNKGSGSLGLWGQIRWQLCGMLAPLIGGVSVLLVAAFAATALNLILLWASTAQVERQVDLMVAQVADRTDSFATRMIAQAESGDGPDRWRGGGRGPGGPRGLQNARASIRCQDAKGQW